MMSKKTIEVTSPHDGKVIKKITLVGKTEVLSALKKADKIFKNRELWLPKYKRIEILEKTVSIMESKIESLTKIAATEGGKPYNDSKVEVLRAIGGVKLAISHLHSLNGEEIPMGLTAASTNRMAFTTREPIGIAVSISAFNHPLNLAIHQIVPMIASGCPVIFKPALSTPMSGMNFVEILYKAGLPKPYCQVLVCEREHASLLVTDPRVAYLSFIGSAKVGWYLRSQLSPGARCALEHGGVAPVIIEPDADIKMALPLLAKGGYYHAGQVCVSVQRIFAHKSIALEVAKGIAKIAKKLVVGNPLNKNTEVGPLINPGEVERVSEWVDEAKKSGAKILCGGKALSKYYYEPTLVYNPSANIKLSKQEVFGPVVCVYEYENLEDAIKEANSLPYAFQASVFTQNIDSMINISQKLNATAVMVNDHTAFRVDWMPFGGRDQSGIGMGGIPYTMHETTREKMLVIKSDAIV